MKWEKKLFNLDIYYNNEIEKHKYNKIIIIMKNTVSEWVDDAENRYVCVYNMIWRWRKINLIVVYWFIIRSNTRI